MAKTYVINSDSTPDLDEWGWDDYWNASHWMQWHAAMKKKYGIDVANKRFIEWWGKQSTGASPLDARSFNSEFRDYARKNGFFDALYGGLSALKVLGAGTDLLSNTSDAVSNISQGAKDTTKSAFTATKIIVPVVIVGAALIGLTLLWKYGNAKIA